MKDRALAYTQLVRLPNWFTAMADVVAGYLVVSGTDIHWGQFSALLVATSMIYGGGCVLNDLRDRQQDLLERPFRPLPSGRIRVREACVLLIVLLAVGLAASLLAGGIPFFIAVLLVLCVCFYDLGTKDLPVLGPLNMALCRGLNLLLGMSLGAAWTVWTLVLPPVTVLYVFSLTRLSRFEVTHVLPFTGLAMVLGWAGVLCALLGLVLGGHFMPGCLIFLFALAACTGRPLWAALANPTPSLVGTAVKSLVLGIPILDAVYVSGVQGWLLGLPVIACLVPAFFISRKVYVT